MFLIPDDILENLTCDQCRKYLSVTPVKVYPNKQILCGRCSKDSDGGYVSLYCNVVTSGLFKCINRYDGCNKILLSTEVVSHEAQCKSDLYGCPNCISKPKMPSLVLVNHFKEQHKDIVLREPIFLINVNRFSVDNKNYFYVKDDFLFVIFVRLNDDHITLNTFHIGNEALSKKITQRFILFSSNGTYHHTTNKMTCCTHEGKHFNEGFTINFNTNECILSVEIHLDTKKIQKLISLPQFSTAITAAENELGAAPIDNELYLSSRFKEMWCSTYTLHSSGNYLININNKTIKNCSFCHNKFHSFSPNLSIYKCTECCSDCGTFICSKCYFFGIKKCDNEKTYNFAPEETTVFKDIQYFCKWNCGQKYFSWKLHDHEFNCNYQIIQKCPIDNCKWSGKLFEMEKHSNDHNTLLYHEYGHSFPLRLVKSRFLLKNKLIIPVSNSYVILKWKNIFDKHAFFFNISNSVENNNYPVAVVSNNGKIQIFTESFVIDLESNPLLLIIIRKL